MQASAGADKYSIGVDIDMCSSAPGNVLASMLKRGDVAVYSLIKNEVEGNKVVAGSTHTFDLASGGVEVKVCDDIAPSIPADVTAKLDEIKKGIADGSIKVDRAK
jgi:basic membrane protein A